MDGQIGEFFFDLGRLFEGIIQRLDRIESAMSDLTAADAALAQAIADAITRIGATNDTQTALIAQLQATVTSDDATISGDTATIADLTAQIAALQAEIAGGIAAAVSATAALNAVDPAPAPVDVPPVDVPPADVPPADVPPAV